MMNDDDVDADVVGDDELGKLTSQFIISKPSYVFHFSFSKSLRRNYKNDFNLLDDDMDDLESGPPSMLSPSSAAAAAAWLRVCASVSTRDGADACASWTLAFFGSASRRCFFESALRVCSSRLMSPTERLCETGGASAL